MEIVPQRRPIVLHADECRCGTYISLQHFPPLPNETMIKGTLNQTASGTLRASDFGFGFR